MFQIGHDVSMTDATQGDAWYWSIDIPGLTEAEASRVVDMCDAEGIGHVGCIPGDPHEWLTMHLDVASVEALAQALARSGGGRAEAGLLETCQDWIAWRERTQNTTP